MSSTQTQNENQNRSKSRIDRMGDTIEQIYDELELKAHLGKMDLERALAKARPRINRLTDEAEELAGEARDRARLKLSKLDARIRDLERRYLRV